MNRMMPMLSAVLTATAAVAVPVVTNVRTEQPVGTRKVTITYDLANEAGIVTVDVRTNRGDGVYASIGDSHLRGLQGDVNRKVSAKSNCKAYWHPGKYWKEGGAQADIKVYVTAWSEKAPPNYMAIGLDKELPGQIEYYTSEDALPEPITSDRWRTTHMLLRKIPARGVTWRIGAGSGEKGYAEWRERPHMVQLTHDYYIGVFEVTQGQWFRVMGAWPAKFSNVACREGRPIENMRPQDIYDFHWPNADIETARSASSGRFFGKLRAQSGLDHFLLLPTEAQWEYAARAGSAAGYTDGSNPSVSTGEDKALGELARYKGNAGTVSDYATAGLEIGTARVGSYRANAWGLYDMLGNVEELCLDYMDNDYVGHYTTSDIYVDPVGPDEGPSSSALRRIDRGGSWCSDPQDTRLGCRKWYVDNPWSSSAANDRTGFRVCYELAD